MQKTASYTKTLESKIIGSQYETAPSLQKHKVQSHFDKKAFYHTLKENTEKELKNPAEESALKAEKEFIQLQENNNQIKAERQKHIKQIMKEKINIEKKAKFKEFIKQRNKKSFSKEKQTNYNTEIRMKINKKKRNSNSNIKNLNVKNNEFNSNNIQQIENLVMPENNKELFYHTIRVNENGDLKSNMLINECENYNADIDNAQINGLIDNNYNHNNNFNSNDDNSLKIKIKYEEVDPYDFPNGNFENEIINYDSNHKSSNDYNYCCYDNLNKQNNDFTQDSNNYFIESNNSHINNLYYANNDSFNIFKENQDLLSKQNQLNNENIIMEANENEENLNDESNKDKNFMHNIIEKTKENQIDNCNVINLRDEMQIKIKAKLKEKQKDYNKKNPFYENEKNEINENNSNTKIRDFLANSKLTFGENLTQDIYNPSSANNQISSCNEINFSTVNNGNLNATSFKNKSNADKYAKHKSFDSNSFNYYCAGNYRNENNRDFSVQKSNQVSLCDNKAKEVDVNKFLDKKISKIKTFRKSGTLIERNYNNTDTNCEYSNEKNSINSFNTENSSYSSSFAYNDLLDNGYRTYSFAVENTKREMLKKQSLVNLGRKTNGWDNSVSTNKMIKR